MVLGFLEFFRAKGVSGFLFSFFFGTLHNDKGHTAKEVAHDLGQPLPSIQYRGLKNYSCYSLAVPIYQTILYSNPYSNH